MVIICSLIFVAAFSQAQDAEEPEWIQLFEDVRYKLYETRMIIEVNQPMMSDRFSVYGQTKVDPKTRRNIIDETDKDKQTELGSEIRIRILRIATSRGLPLVTTCVLTQDAIAVFKKDRYTWDMVTPEVLKILELLR